MAAAVDEDLASGAASVGIFGFLRGADEPSFHGRLKSGGLDDFIVQEIGLDGSVCNVAEAASSSAWKQDLVPKEQQLSKSTAALSQPEFLHSQRPEGLPASSTADRCRDFSQGRCSRGNNCRYRHGGSATNNNALKPAAGSVSSSAPVATAATAICVTTSSPGNLTTHTASDDSLSDSGLKRKERDDNEDNYQEETKKMPAAAAVSAAAAEATPPLPSLLPLEVLVPDASIRSALVTAHDQYWVHGREDPRLDVVVLPNCPIDRDERTAVHSGIIAHLPFARTEVPKMPTAIRGVDASGSGGGSVVDSSSTSSTGGTLAYAGSAGNSSGSKISEGTAGAAIAVRRSNVLDGIRSVLEAPRALPLPSVTSDASTGTSTPAAAAAEVDASHSSLSPSSSSSSPALDDDASSDTHNDVLALQRLVGKCKDPATGALPSSAVIGRDLDRKARTAVHQGIAQISKGLRTKTAWNSAGIFVAWTQKPLPKAKKARVNPPSTSNGGRGSKVSTGSELATGTNSTLSDPAARTTAATSAAVALEPPIELDGTPSFLRVVLYKEGVEHLAAMKFVASALGVRLQDLSVSGIKDKRGQTHQWVHVRNDTTNCSTVTPAQRLHRLLQSSQSSSQAVAVAPLLPPSSSLKSNDLNGKGNADDQPAVSGAAQHQSTEAAKNDGGQGQWGVEVEEGAIILAYAGAASEPLQVGQGHSGNKFAIILRDIRTCHDTSSSTHAPTAAAIAAAVASINHRGFINYFGFQRVGEPVLSRNSEETARTVIGSRAADISHPDGTLASGKKEHSGMDIDTPSNNYRITAATSPGIDSGSDCSCKNSSSNSSSSSAAADSSQWDGAPAWKVGRALVRGQWEDAIDLLLGGDCASLQPSVDEAGGAQTVTNTSHSSNCSSDSHQQKCERDCEKEVGRSNNNNTHSNLTGVAKARHLWRSSRDSKQCLKVWPLSMPRERQLLQGLLRFGDSSSALQALPHAVRTMWVHAFQSYLFNHAASLRAARLPTTDTKGNDSNSHDSLLEVGDLLLVPTAESQVGNKTLLSTTRVGDMELIDAGTAAAAVCDLAEESAEGSVEDRGEHDRRADNDESAAHSTEQHQRSFRVVPWMGPSEPSPYGTRKPTINDVVLPLVGTGVQLPTGQSGKDWVTLLSAHLPPGHPLLPSLPAAAESGTLHAPGASHDALPELKDRESRRSERLPRGAYRKLMAHPGRLTWEPLPNGKEDDAKRLANQASLKLPGSEAPLVDGPKSSAAGSVVHAKEAAQNDETLLSSNTPASASSAGHVRGEGSEALSLLEEVTAARFSFALPTGAYATVLMREVTRSDHCLYSYLS